MTKKLFMIHGAWSSKNVFNYLKLCLDKKASEYHCFEYESIGTYDILKNNRPNIRKIISDAKKELNNIDGDVIVVGHSLGGLVSLGLEAEKNVCGIVTVASPISGIKINKIAETFLTVRAPLLRDILHYSSFIEEIHNKPYTKPIKCIVTTNGYNPMIMEKSDGVISVESQESWKPSTAEFEYISANHQEVLQTEEFVKVVNSLL